MSNDYFSMIDAAKAPPADLASPSAPSLPAAAANTDYFAAVDQAHATIAKQHVLANADANPDNAATAQKVSDQIGVAQPAVEQDLAGFKQQAQSATALQVMDTQPAVAQFVAQNPMAARIANDDFENMGFLAKTWNSLQTGMIAAFAANQTGRLGNEAQLAGVLPGPQLVLSDLIAPKKATPSALDNQIAGQRMAGDVPMREGFQGGVQKVAGFLGGLMDNLIAAIPEASGGAALGAVGGGVGAIPGAISGAGIGLKADMARVAAGNQYLALTALRDRNGQPLSEGAKQVGSLLTGAGTYALAGVGGGEAGKLTDEAASALLRDAVAESVVRPTVGKALQTFTSSVIKGSFVGAALNAGMTAATQVGQIFAATVDNTVAGRDFATAVNDPVERGKMVTELANAAEEGALMFGGLHAVTGTGTFLGDTLRARQAQINVQAFSDLAQGAEASKLRERAPAMFRDFMDQQATGAKMENVFVPAEAVDRLYQSGGIDATRSDPLFDFVPDMQQQLAEARLTGGDVVIPTADYLTHLVGTPLADKLLPDIRLSADGMSLNEAAEQQKSAQKLYDDYAKQVDTSDAKADPVQAIADDVHAQVLAAGYTDSQARQYGALFSSRYAARAERLGTDPLAEYQRTPLEIRRADAPVADALNQSTPEGPRASIHFEDGKSVISLFANSDRSSILHESGHLFLNELAEDAQRPEAPDGLKADFAKTMDFLGVNGDWHAMALDEQRAAHEKFATAFETYLMEGKAPSAGLRGAFTRFASWLTKIYRSAQAIGSPVTPEMREVFDRLLATDEQIARARDNVAQRAQLDTTGMSKREAEAYRKAIERSNIEQHDTLVGKMMASVRAKYAKEGREALAAVREEVDAELAQRPDLKAYDFLHSGKVDEGSTLEPFKLNTADVSLDAGYGDQAIPKGLTSHDGVHPDVAAELLGFRSGTELVKALQNLEEARQAKSLETGKAESIRKTQRDNLVDERMDARYPPPTPEEMQAEAMDAVHNAMQDKVTKIEARVIARLAGKALIDLDDIRGFAEKTISEKTVKDATNASGYARTEKKAASEVEKALLAKDYASAYLFKRQQILNHELYKQASAAAREVQKATALFERLTKKESFKGIDQDYLNQIHDLLQRFGYDTGRGDELARTKGETLQEFVTRKSEDAGLDLAVDPALFDMQGTSVNDMPMQDFRALDDAVRSLQALGRDEKMIIVNGEKVEFDGVVDQIVTAIRALGERPKSDFYEPGDAGSWAKVKDRMFRFTRGVDASLVKIEALFDQIDQEDPFGIMNTSVFRRLKDAQHNENQWHEVSAREMHEAVKAMPKGWEKRLDDVVPEEQSLLNPETGAPMRLTRKRVLSMALNYGNEGNRAKLAAGYGWTDASIKAFLDKNMAAHDWQFVQRIWDMFDTHKDALDQLQQRTTGVGLDLVQADRFDTPHGPMRGGYFPIVYDPGKSFRSEELAAKGAADTLFPSNYTRATTPKGNTISRVEGVKRPIQLSLDIVPWKIGQVIHDLAFREAIIDSDRLLSSGRVKSAMDDVFGSEYRKLLRPWLKSIANSRNIDDAAISWIDKAISTARTNTVIVGIGFRLTTIAKHGLTAASNSVGELGVKWMSQGLREFYGPGMRDKWQMIKDKSPEMAYRLDAYDKDLMQSYDHLLKDSAYTAFQKGAQHFGHMGVSYVDMGTAAPTWLGAYRKALSEDKTEADAIYFADKTVRNAHGAQGITDTAQIQRASGAVNLVNMFYGFFNHIYNRQRTAVIDASRGVSLAKQGDYRAATRNFGSVLAKSWYYLAVPGMIEALIATGGPKEDKDEGWGGWAAKAILGQTAAGIPILRDIAKAAIEGRDYEGSPIVNAVNGVLRGGRDISKIVQGEDAPSSTSKHIATAAGLVSGLPTQAPFTAGKFLWDYNNGDADPQTVGDWLRGLTTGKTEEHK